MSGFVSGSLWGLTLGGVGLILVSQLNELPAGSEPPLTPQLTAPQTASNEAAPEGLAPNPPAAETEFSVDVPRVAVPEAEVEAPTTDTTPSTPPTVPDIATALTVPEDVSDPEITAGLDEPTLSRTVTSSPEVPLPEEDVVIATQPAQAAPAPAEPDSNDVAGVAEDAAIVPVPDAPADDTTPVVAEASEPEVLPEIAEVPQTPAVVEEAPEIVVEAPDVDVVEAPVAPDVAVVAPEPESAPETSDVAAPPDVAGPAPEVLVVGTTETTETPLPQVNAGVRVNRPGAEPTETAGQDSEIVPEDETADDAPAVVRYATEFEAASDLPLMSILLLDDGAGADGPEQVSKLPFPITVIIDALAPDANAQMRAYRDANVEVVMQTSLPVGAVPTDVEVAFEAAFDILPETVALFSGGEGILQNNRAVTEQVIEVLQSEGRGLLVVQRGLSSAIRGAEQVGLPAAPILRDLDGGGEDAASIARALDQAAFRARQAGDAVLLARIAPETIQALQNWGTENDGDQIALAPVSAILRDDADSE